MSELYDVISKEISVDNMYRHMDVLVNDIGERLSGTEEMKQAAEYIEAKLKASGLNTRIDKFPMYHSFPGEAELKVMSPSTVTIESRPVCHISSTLPCGMEGELIYLGVGGYADYEGVDVANKIVLTDMNWNPSRPEKARIAWEKGAKALIIMNWGRAEDNLIQMGAVKSQWGNPEPETFKDIPQITVLSISRYSGEYLRALCDQGTVRVWLKADATREWVEAVQPTAFLKGSGHSGEFVLVGSHVDAWGKSAICNASGNAINLELARVLSSHSDMLRRDVVFAFWDGHEIAEGGGSTWFCDNYWSYLTDKCVAYINIDNLAIKGTTVPGVEGQPELKTFLMNAVKNTWGRGGIWHNAYKGGGDSSFFGVGVPYISFATEYTDEMLKALNYAFYSPWLHSDYDTVDKVDRELYIGHMNYFSYILCELLQTDIIPYKIDDLALDISRQYNELCSFAGSTTPYVADLKNIVAEYCVMAAKVEELKNDSMILSKKENIDILNDLLLFIERRTCVFRNVAGRYGQDACGLLAAEKPVPSLYRAVNGYKKCRQISDEYYLWETKLMREQNRVYDMLNDAVKYAEKCFALMDIR